MLLVTNKNLLTPLFIVIVLKLCIVTGLDNLVGLASSVGSSLQKSDAAGIQAKATYNELLRHRVRAQRYARNSNANDGNNDDELKHNYHGDSVSLDTLDGTSGDSNNNRKEGKLPSQTSQAVVTSDWSGEQTRRRRRSRQNLCEHLCSCDLDAKFVTVNCSFLLDKEYVLGEQYSIPNTTRRLRINLADRTALRIDDGFFKNSNVNSVQITGLVGSGGQIEITKHAFSQNFAVYPEIVVNRCSKLILKEHAFRGRLIE